MKTHNIALNIFPPKGGISLDMQDGILHMTTNRNRGIYGQCGSNPCLCFPERYKLPVRIEMSAKIDSPQLNLYFGNGHLFFNAVRPDGVMADIIKYKPGDKQQTFDNRLPLNEFADISIIYGCKAMQILVNGKERFYSEDERYMKPQSIKESNETGFELKLSCTPRTDLYIQSVKITEYDEEPEINRNIKEDTPLIISVDGLYKNSSLENCISLIPDEFKTEILNTNAYLMSLKPAKFKRKITGGRVTYISSHYGISYTILFCMGLFSHHLQFYIIHNNKWGNKTKDYMMEVLELIYAESPELALKIFDELPLCAGGIGGGCVDHKDYEFHGIAKNSCNGRLSFKMTKDDFKFAREFMGYVNRLDISNL